MADVIMKAYKAAEITFVNKHENGTKLQFGNKFSYNVKYSGNNCVGELTAEAYDKDAPEKFGVKIVLNGIFDFNPELKKEQIHILTFKELYPYAKSIVSCVSASAGVPPIILPPFDIENQSIYKFEKNI